MEVLDGWLRHAPKAASLESGERWEVFPRRRFERGLNWILSSQRTLGPRVVFCRGIARHWAWRQTTLGPSVRRDDTGCCYLKQVSELSRTSSVWTWVFSFYDTLLQLAYSYLRFHPTHAVRPAASVDGAALRRVVQATSAACAVDAIRGSGRRVVTFCGFSAAGYEDAEEVERLLCEQLARFSPQFTIICSGATVDGIGMIYPLARRAGFRTVGIVSSRAEAECVALSNDVEVVYVVRDAVWGGRQDGRLSPTSEATVEACDEMIGVSGGAIARDELEEARQRGKPVCFIPADMNHALAMAKARKLGAPTPTDFRGEAHTLFL
jgi:hypothetical protein